MLDALLEPLEGIREFLDAGGTVLWAILFATVLMWMLILERYLFLLLQFPARREVLARDWSVRQDRGSWYARRIRDYLVAEAAAMLQRHLLVIRTLTALLPLLGLLGTVDGMIHTFDIMNVFGTGNARGMAGGISQALITTMAGLVGALSGLYLSANLDHRAETETQRFADQLQIQVN